jgi:hypothetical protein
LLCAHHVLTNQWPYLRGIRNALSDAFDAYLAVQRELDRLVAKILGQVGENWRVLNACPPCNYEVSAFSRLVNSDPDHTIRQLDDELALVFSRMWVVDGNNSLKRVGPLGEREEGDCRVYDSSDYFLPTEFVDRYACEVKSRTKSTDDDDIHDAPDENDGDPTDGTPDSINPAPCADNWKAAAAEERKRMWAIFEESGVFASACRHGFVLWIADMVRCGEL